LDREEKKGKIQTVLGLIDGKDMGVTLPHEHLLIDLKCVFCEPEEAGAKELAHQPVTLENLDWVLHNSWYSLDNLRLLNEEVATNEAMFYKKAGGNTICEASNIGLGRDPEGLARISTATGLNIVMGAGYYREISISAEAAAKSQEEITTDIVNDIEVGVGPRRIRAGYIGEIGNSWPWTDTEKKNLRAAIAAQKRTGAALMIHPGFYSDAPFAIIDLLKAEGAELSHTIICHMGAAFGASQSNERLKLAKTGVFMEFDTFSREGYFAYGASEDFAWAPPWPSILDVANDGQQIDHIKELFAAGHGKQILISTDICKKNLLVKYGGSGYAHILKRVLPIMRLKGMSSEEIDTIIVENPKRALSFF